MLSEDERLNAKPIANEIQISRARVPERKRKHTFYRRAAFVDTGLLVQVHENLGVGFTNKAVPLPNQTFSQHTMIVYFAIHDDADRAILVPKWLRCGSREVNDREASM